MRLTAQRKHILAACAALTFAGLIAASAAALTTGGAADVDSRDQRSHQPRASGEITYTTAGVLEEPVPAPADPAVMRPRRTLGTAMNPVGEYLDMAVSPIQTATAVSEPAHEPPPSLHDNGQPECREFHSLIVDGKEWDLDVVLAMAWRESRCNARLVSVTNDWGLLQLNATCWAGTSIDGLPEVPSLPASVAPADLLCDGRTQSTLTAQWCYRAKEAAYDTGHRPASPCDAWLDPTVNLAAAYELWERYGWRPWCFNDQLRATPACRAAGESL